MFIEAKGSLGFLFSYGHKSVNRLHVQLVCPILSVVYPWSLLMFERCVYFNTHALARKLNAIWDEGFSEFDLTPAQGYLLRLVLAQPSLTQQAISQELQLNKSTVTRFVNQLEKKSLLERTASDSDLRENVIIPSKSALAINAKLESLGESLYQTMCNKLGKQDLTTFVKTARKLNRQL